MLQRKFIKFDLKAVSEDGVFSGIASTYGNTDRGGDLILKGAFAKTLAEGGPTRPLLWQHDPDSPIGLCELKDSDAGLLVDRGTILRQLEDGTKAYETMKAGIVKGLSIGYEAMQWEYQQPSSPDAWPIRILKEVKLWEVSVVTFPMNEAATVTSVKSVDGPLMRYFADEILAGRDLPEAHLRFLGECKSQIEALLLQAKAAAPPSEPVDDHSRAISIISRIRAEINR